MMKPARENLIPYALLAELTHRCPLRCPYCSNPLELERASAELSTDEWKRVLDEAVAMGMLQVHFSGGEPTVRRDLEVLIAHAVQIGLYTNLITSGVLLSENRVAALAEAGLDHVQISFQDTEPENADRIAGFAGYHKKIKAAYLVRQEELPLTLNAVMHRQNLSHLPQIIELAVKLGAERLEVAQVQYYGWALKNQGAFLPTRKQLDEATEIVESARKKLRGRLVIDYVVPDYYARQPKSCMGGWGRRFLNVTPAGKVLPCHAAETLKFLEFDSIRERSLAWIWENSKAFLEFRGTAWMPEPCRSCPQREVDWGGCRCQAFALTGKANVTDPACEKSPDRDVLKLPLQTAQIEAPEFLYRSFSHGGALTSID
tara:strand:- start:397 stop:1515 length:1119 start_codon:yes stop_codon:yes gene_type:complete